MKTKMSQTECPQDKGGQCPKAKVRSTVLSDVNLQKGECNYVGFTLTPYN